MMDRIGQRLGNYTLVQLLGRGGFADVYLAEHIYLKTQVAIKVLQTRLSTPEDTDRFLQEAQLIARLSHPHIVRVMDFGLDGEIPFLVMDYVPNGTLRQHHPRGTQLPIDLIVSYVKQLAEPLQYAHDERIIHRDIKPENMLFGKRHEIVLSDFGVAFIAQSSRYQSAQDVAGTVGYMAPEQIQGRSRPASDQYALGIVVYEWISGDRPFHGSFMEVCSQHLFAPLPSLREKVPEILPSVEHVISLALAKEPKQRFANVQAFARALEQASQAAAPLVLAASIDSPLASVEAQPATQIQPEAIGMPVSSSSAEKVSAESASATPQIEAAPIAASSTSQAALPSTILAANAEAPALAPAVQAPPQSDNIPSQPVARGSGWSIKGQQIAAMAGGLTLFGLACYFLDLFFVAASSNGFSSSPYQTLWLAGIAGFSLLNVGAGFSLIIPAFFAARFGPWVGLVSATLGLLLGQALSDTFTASFTSWYSYITYALFGFITGLAFIRTRGRYTTRAAVLSFIGFSISGLIAALVWQYIEDNHFNPPAPVTSFYLPLVLVYCLPGLLILIALLAVHRGATHVED